jgi:hypothetical protein
MSEELVPVRVTVDIYVDKGSIRRLEMADMERAITTLNRFFEHTWGELANGTNINGVEYKGLHYGPKAKEILGIGSANQACETCTHHSIDEEH